LTRRGATAGSALFFAVAPGVVAGLLPWWLTGWRFEAFPLPLRLVGALLTIAAGLVLVSAFARFVMEGIGTPAPVAPTRHLVVGGLYRYVRNPMYIGVITALGGEALLFRSRHMLEYALIVWTIMHLFVCFYEESRLTRTYGNAYLSYKSGVPRWFPRLSPWREAAPSDVE
jgi:protein-S-isoprenylcysteine O-methyltransferase Ste14